MRRLFLFQLVFFLLFLLCTPLFLSHAQSISLSGYKQNEEISGFQVTNQYLGSQNQVMGLRLTHLASGAIIHLLQMNTIPQAAISIRTYQKSNHGAAHALEHILLSRGKTGHSLNVLQNMVLGENSAATGDAYTWYHFHVNSGINEFYQLFDKMMNALFQPDFSDQEASHEIYHWGISTNEKTGEKQLLEQGTVYTEMEKDQGFYNYWYEGLKMALGEKHPLVFYGGGYPEIMRSITPKDIREFHQNHYVLGPTISIVLVIPFGQSLPAYFTQIDTILKSVLSANQKKVHGKEIEKNIKIESAQNPEIRLIPFPSQSETDEGKIVFFWKPVQFDSLEERMLFELFLEIFGNGSQSLMYRDFVEQKSRVLQTAATNVSMDSESTYSSKELIPYFRLSGIPGQKISREKLLQVQEHFLKKIAEVKNDQISTKELLFLNHRALSIIADWQRRWSIFTVEPPAFGERGISNTWLAHFRALEEEPGFQKSLVHQEAFLRLIQKLQSNQNVWSPLLQKARLAEAPYGSVGIPSQKQFKKIVDEKKQRLLLAQNELKKRYQTLDEQLALSRFELAEQEKERLVEAQTKIPIPAFTEHPPFGFDESIQYQKSNVAGISSTNSFFPGSSLSEVGFYFDLRSIPTSFYKYLPILPLMLNSLGLKEGKEVTSHQLLSEHIQKNINFLDVSYSTNKDTNRYELKLSASGSNLKESKLALQYLRKISHFNHLSIENLPRIQDVLEQSIQNEDTKTKQAEEFWVKGIADAFQMQHHPLYLVLQSIPTRAHLLHRLKWQLEGTLSKAEFLQFQRVAKNILTLLEHTPSQQLENKLAGIQKTGVLGKWVEYLKTHLKEFPAEHRLAGFHRLYKEVMADIQVGREQTLEEIKQLQSFVLNRSSMRMYQVGDQAMLQQLEQEVTSVIQSFAVQTLVATGENQLTQGVVSAHLQKRDSLFISKYPLYIGYLYEDSLSGNIVIESKSPGFQAKTEQELFELLAPHLLVGSGPHSLSIKTWKAGLAYGNWVAANPYQKKLFYYAGLCPSIQKTLQFVRKTTEDLSMFSDPSYRDYLLAQVFDISREGKTPLQRGVAIDLDLQDGKSPEKVKAFYQKVWNLHKQAYFLKRINQILPTVLNRVILGRGDEEEKKANETLFFFIAPEKQLQEIETDIPHQRLYRVWSSDFWLDF